MVVPNTFAALDLVNTVYLMSILADHRRPIDRYIEYFGTGASGLEPPAARQGAVSQGTP